jgi:hypothetical protein
MSDKFWRTIGRKFPEIDSDNDSRGRVGRREGGRERTDRTARLIIQKQLHEGRHTLVL